MLGLSLAAACTYQQHILTVPALDTFQEILLTLKDAKLSQVELSVDSGQLA